MKEQLVLACECGTTVKMSSLSREELATVQLWWDLRHGGHEQVTCAEARQVRDRAGQGERHTLRDAKGRFCRV